jgi:hypothetical protein
VASYGGCRIDHPGSGYRLAATGGGYAPAYSSRFNVSARSTTIGLTTGESVISLGASVDLTIQFAAQGAGRVVQLQKKTALDAGWVSFASATMDTSGRAVVQVTPEFTARYRAVFAGAADLGPAMSAVAEVAVRHRASLEPRSKTGLRVFTKPVRVTYRGHLEPITDGQTMTFQIYQKVRGAWVYRTAKSVIADDAGRATFSWTWTRGQWYIRVRANATLLNTWGYSNIEKVTVR